MNKKIILMLSLLLIPIVMAVYEPAPPTDPLDVDKISLISISSPLAITPLAVAPIPPTTDTEGECVPWNVKDEYCIDNIRHYTMCQKTVTGGKWQLHSEDCSGYGVDVKCSGGECRKVSSILFSIVLFLVGFVAGFFLINLIPIPIPSIIKSILGGLILGSIGYWIGGLL